MQSKKITPALQEIQVIENKYGLEIFGFGLVHVICTGSNNFTENNVATKVDAIQKEDEINKQKGIISIMTAEYKIEIVKCAAELARIKTMDLLRYVKKYVHIK